MGVTGDSQSILNEVSKLRQKYDECRESQGVIKGIDPKVLAQSKEENRKLMVQITQKEGIIKSLEQTMLVRDRSYRETNARNKNLIAQIHTQNVTQQEREMLKKALVSTKAELALAQKELRGGSASVVRMREELQASKATIAKLQSVPLKTQSVEKIPTKVVEQTEKLRVLKAQLDAANTVIAQLRSTPPKSPIQTQPPQVIEKVVYRDRPVEKVVEKIVYKDRPIEKGKVVEKVVYKDRPIEKEKIVEKVVYRDRPVEKIVEKIVYKDRPIEKDKVVEKVVYKDRPIEKEKIVEKVVYRDRPVEKIVEKVVYKDRAVLDENVQRKMDKLALELERQKSLNAKLASDLSKTPVKRITAAALPPLPPVNTKPQPLPKATIAPVAKTVQPAEESVSTNVKKSAGVYRMASNASIYNGPNGKVVDTWEARRSFTGSGASNGWIHITGYFVNRVFQGVVDGENLWVKESDAIRR